jgi:hypothetical protein
MSDVKIGSVQQSFSQGADLSSGLTTSIDSKAAIADQLKADPMAGNDQVEGIVAGDTSGTAPTDAPSLTDTNIENHVGDGKTSVLGQNHVLKVSDGDFSAQDSIDMSRGQSTGFSHSDGSSVAQASINSTFAGQEFGEVGSEKYKA